ncbi:MAG: glycolate oxidase subunit GlcF [Chromatiales bacterium]
MQTALLPEFLKTPNGEEADRILRTCVHCGFCTATCPTYQLLGDELDGPRGRIYLIKAMLEGGEVTQATQLHLDRCLTCRACEPTCPSGVQYGRLLDIGRMHMEELVPRNVSQRLVRYLLRWVLPHRWRFACLMRPAQWLRPLLPAVLKRKIPPLTEVPARPTRSHARKVLMLEGCVQPILAPSINAHAAQVLDELEIQAVTVEQAGCCGALSHHLCATEEALECARRNIDAWWPRLEAGAEAVVITASACATMIKAYGHLLRHDRRYARKAAGVSEAARDIVEVLAREDLAPFVRQRHERIAFHAPCTLQHGERLAGVTEQLLSSLGYTLTPVKDAHLCCGSAGTYSILQPALAKALRERKLENLQTDSPAIIATANIGCLAFLQEKAGVPVRHWIELIAR